MKSFIKIALLLFYVFFNAGVSYSMHFCGDDFKRVNFFADIKSCCDSKEPMPDCCEDVLDWEQPNSDQKLAGLGKVVIPNVSFVNNIVPVYNRQLPLVQSRKLVYANSSPPIYPTLPLYLRNQTFII